MRILFATLLALIVAVVIVAAGSALADEGRDHGHGHHGGNVAVSQGGDDTTAVAIPRAPDRTSLTEAQAICKSAPASAWCVQAEEQSRTPFLCRRIKGVFGIPDLPFVGRYC